jgi:hypothetical protein
MTRPSYSIDHPQRINVTHRQDQVGAALTVVDNAWGPLQSGPVPTPMRAALGERAAQSQVAVFPGGAPGLSALSVAVDLPIPEWDILADGADGSERKLRLRLRSPRGAATLLLALPRGPRIRASCHGLEITTRVPAMESAIAFRGVPPTGIEIELRAPTAEPLDLALYDVTPGLPAGSLAAKVAAARPPNAAPYQEGDITVLRKHGSI